MHAWRTNHNNANRLVGGLNPFQKSNSQVESGCISQRKSKLEHQSVDIDIDMAMGQDLTYLLLADDKAILLPVLYFLRRLDKLGLHRVVFTHFTIAHPKNQATTAEVDVSRKK